MGIVQESRSEWGTSTILVTKKDGDWRLCVNYRALNKITRNEPYPMPLVEDLVNDVGCSSWFCLLDLKSAYWQVPMDKASIAKTAFSTKRGHYEFTHMSMGLKTAVFTFQRAINTALYSVQQACQAYLDDLLVHARIFNDGLEALECVLKLLLKHGLQASFKKCKFLMRQVPYLGRRSVRQGCPLALALYILLTDFFIYCVNEDGRIKGLRDPRGREQKISGLADDMLLALLPLLGSIEAALEIIGAFSLVSRCKVNWLKRNTSASM